MGRTKYGAKEKEGEPARKGTPAMRLRQARAEGSRDPRWGCQVQKPGAETGLVIWQRVVSTRLTSDTRAWDMRGHEGSPCVSSRAVSM